MNAFDCYKLFVSLKAHFTAETYDFAKYGIKKIKYETFNLRKDNVLFEVLSKKYNDADLKDLIIANLFHNSKYYIRDLINEEAKDILINYVKIRDSLEYTFKNECDKLFTILEQNKVKFDEIFNLEQGKYPLIIRLVLQKEIIPETYLLFNHVLDFQKKLSIKDPILEEFIFKMKKYDILMNKPDKKIIKKIILESMKSHLVLV